MLGWLSGSVGKGTYAKLDDLSLIPRTSTVEGEELILESCLLTSREIQRHTHCIPK